MRPKARSTSSNPHGAVDLFVRDARRGDSRTIEEVHFAARAAAYSDKVADWPPPGPDRPGRIARWERWLSDPDISTLVGESSGELVGFCTIRSSPEDDTDAATAEMATLYVRPDRWHRGVGRTLCEAGLERARRRGFQTLVLWVLDINERARTFYEHLGFVADGRTKVDEMTRERLVAHRYAIGLEEPAAR
ncbi:MAG: GNAT family N-acetyltransferase [Longimicrobiales bacterium]|nr:GNAT family N-acetyltransferase [Longimicrobiales bacterium]